MTSPHTHPAERETPAGEAMREAVAQWLESEVGLYVSDAAEKAGEFCGPSGPIASELARLRAIVSSSEAERYQKCSALLERALAAEAEREEARADIEALKEWAGDPEGWPSLKTKWDALVAAAEEEAALRLAAEAALTTLRADHAAEVARLTEALRFYADEDAWSGQPWRLQFESPGRDGHGSDTARDALATTETTDA